jgi:hypothetical protein
MADAGCHPCLVSVIPQAVRHVSGWWCEKAAGLPGSPVTTKQGALICRCREHLLEADTAHCVAWCFWHIRAYQLAAIARVWSLSSARSGEPA